MGGWSRMSQWYSRSSSRFSHLLLLCSCTPRLLDARQPSTQSVLGDVWSPRPRMYKVNVSHGPGQTSLFEAGGPVHVFCGHDVDATVTATPRETWLIMYYSSECPHCWYFAPVFHELADAYRGSSSMNFGAVNCEEIGNSKACGDAGVFSYPGLLAYNLLASGQEEHIIDVPHLRDEEPLSPRSLAAWLSNHSPTLAPPHPELLSGGANFEESNGTSGIAVDDPPGPPGWPEEDVVDLDRFDDARLGFIHLLTRRYNSTGKLDVVRRAVRFMAEAFPTDNAAFADLEKRVSVSYDGSSSRLQSMDVRSVVIAWGKQFPPEGSTLCKSKSCLLWQLFHVVAAAVAGSALTGKHLVSQQVSPASPGLPTVRDAMSFIRDMVDNFFDCADCRRHFLAAYDSCAHGRCDVLNRSSEADRAQGMVLWLWRVHNSVSLRVVHEHPPHGAAIDRRWPTYRDCPGCWKEDVVSGHRGEGADNGSLDSVYDPDRVFGYLLSCYIGRENLDVDSNISNAVIAKADASMVKTSLGEIMEQNMIITVILVLAICAAAVVVARLASYSARSKRTMFETSDSDDGLEHWLE